MAKRSKKHPRRCEPEGTRSYATKHPSKSAGEIGSNRASAPTASARWRIVAAFRLHTPMHLGDGGVELHSRLTDDLPEVWVPTLIRDEGGLPCIPGSSLKGALRTLAVRKGATFEGDVFGERKDIGTVPGRVEFMTAYMDPEVGRSLSGALERERDRYGLPNFGPDRRQALLPRTAIDRVARAVVPRKLFHESVVPPGAVFRTELICDDLHEPDVRRLLWLLKQIDDVRFVLGSGATRGRGRVRCEAVEVERFGIDECKAWLAALPAEPKPWYQACKRVALEPLPAAPAKEETIEFKIKLSFHSPFLVKQAGDKDRDQADAIPRRDHQGKVMLPASAFRGALRAQCERILRTLGAKVPQGHAAAALRESETALPDLASVLFGATGWRGVLTATDFAEASASTSKRQEMVAIDRLTGGGKSSAKFNVDYVECPTLTGSMMLDLRRLKLAQVGPGGALRPAMEPALGLLALALRDLDDGDIAFGHGRAKGYGQCTADALSPWLQRESFASVDAYLQALRALHPPAAPDDGGLVQKPLMEPLRAAPHPGPRAGDGFHNPYAFIPFAKPKEPWQPRDQLADSVHSHDRYGGLCGRIVCKLSTRTPIFVGAEQKQELGGPTMVEPFRLKQPVRRDGRVACEERIALPATSLRGMISSLFESISASNVRVMHDAPMSMRKDAYDALSAMGRIVVRDGRHLLEPLCPPSQPGQRWERCFPELLRAMTKVPLGRDPAIDYSIDRWYYLKPSADGAAMSAPATEKKSDSDIRGYVRTLRLSDAQSGGGAQRDIPANFARRLHFIPCPELLDTLPDDKRCLLEIPPAVVAQFHALADDALDRMNDKPEDIQSELLRPYVPAGRRAARDRSSTTKPPYATRLQDGDLVYFDVDDSGDVSEVSFSAIWRQGPMAEGERWTARRFVEAAHGDLLPLGVARSDGTQRSALSPAELLFGVVDEKGRRADAEPGANRLAFAFASKVRVGYGIATKAVQPMDEVELKELSSPKPPSPALYFSSATGPGGWLAKAELARNPTPYRLNGRKAYLHAQRLDGGAVATFDGNGTRAGKGAVPWQSIPPDGGDSTYDRGKKRRMRIRPIEGEFVFEIDFDNLTQTELEMLCAALHPSEAFEHKLGLGKPIGLGSVKIRPIGLFIVDRRARYGRDSLNGSRYAQAWRADAASDEQAAARWPFHLSREERWSTQGVPCPSPLDLAMAAMSRTDPAAARALHLLGDPAHVVRPVHYPQKANEHLELRTYQWFVHNDGRTGPDNRQTLGPIDENTSSLQKLQRP